MSIALRNVRFSRPVLAASALLLLLGVAAMSRMAVADDSSNYPQASLTAPTDPAALLARGKYLTAAADCMPCHTGPNHAPFSGGLMLNTPFGGLPSSNITPDKTTGIGNWTDRQFYDAVHYGVAPGRSYLLFPRFLYPGMPYTSYTKLSYADVMAIKAYIFSQPAVNVAPTPNTLGFPFSQRPVLLGWRILFFRAGPMKMDPSWDESMKNGAYLTEVLGHCGECHTPRNLLSAMMPDKAYAGSPIDGFFAPNNSSDKEYGVGGWAQSDLVAYLHNDGNMTKGSAFGPMLEVVQNSTSQIPLSDVQDIANYLQTQTKPQNVPPTGAAGNVPAAAQLGAEVYAANCAGCHGQDGAGRAPIIPNLAGNDSVTAEMPNNVIGAVLTGLPPWKNGPAMPSFAASLPDNEIAALANYVRTAWGNKGSANATPHDVMALRNVMPVPPMANMASDQFGCPHVSGAGGASTVADPGSNLMDIYNGATPETLPNRTRALISAVRAANSGISNADLVNTVVAAYCPVIANQPGVSIADKQAALVSFVAGIQPLIEAPAVKAN